MANDFNISNMVLYKWLSKFEEWLKIKSQNCRHWRGFIISIAGYLKCDCMSHPQMLQKLIQNITSTFKNVSAVKDQLVTHLWFYIKVTGDTNWQINSLISK